MTYDCRSVLKHVLKCYDIFADVHNNRKSCRGPVVSRCRMRQKSYRVNRPLEKSRRIKKNSHAAMGRKIDTFFTIQSIHYFPDGVVSCLFGRK